MDATRLSDSELVAIKSFPKRRQEEQIARFFASIRDPRNHCVRVHEILSDPHDPRLGLMVMPFLRPCNNPEFATVGDVIEFVDQTLEVGVPTVESAPYVLIIVQGLAFMHSHNVAHRYVSLF